MKSFFFLVFFSNLLVDEVDYDLVAHACNLKTVLKNRLPHHIV